MTTDKLPDVVKVGECTLCGGTDYFHSPSCFGHERPDKTITLQSALDAMTAERDEARDERDDMQRLCKVRRDERDSAREALRAIRDSTYRNAVTLRWMADNFLAAQPETNTTNEPEKGSFYMEDDR